MLFQPHALTEAQARKAWKRPDRNVGNNQKRIGHCLLHLVKDIALRQQIQRVRQNFALNTTLLVLQCSSLFVCACPLTALFHPLKRSACVAQLFCVLENCSTSFLRQMNSSPYQSIVIAFFHCQTVDQSDCPKFVICLQSMLSMRFSGLFEIRYDNGWIGQRIFGKGETHKHKQCFSYCKYFY
jgi:hypothetical protein